VNYRSAPLEAASSGFRRFRDVVLRIASCAPGSSAAHFLIGRVSIVFKEVES
jgi:hypothetical protein